MSRGGRKRRRGPFWTPWKGEATPLRGLSDAHLANILHMIDTGEVHPGGEITETYQMDEAKRLMLKKQGWELKIVTEQARRLLKEKIAGV